MASISVVITCKGRLEHLRQTLPLVARHLPDAELILVDYDCPDRCGDWAEANVPGALVVRVRNRPTFNLAKARNLGIARASAPWLLLADADVLFNAPLPPALAALMGAPAILLPDPRPPELFGTILVPRADALAIGGYDETFEGWGVEDEDFLMRLEQRGLARRRFQGDAIAAITHDDALRSRFHDRGRALSWTLNCLYLDAKRDLIRLDQRLSARGRQALYEALRNELDRAASQGDAVRQQIHFRRERIGDLEVSSALAYAAELDPAPTA
ncbi:glycosyltransferase family 2 protein [Caulobacter sp. KR2-114]|uniref:glycosyltransferase family 2 protein n=1 Tax=Caulobacter sp. KR2-114 TaxID=3400912 RepID=UPI003C0780B1